MKIDNENENEFTENEQDRGRKSFRGVMIAVVCILIVGGAILALNGGILSRDDLNRGDELPPVSDQGLLDRNELDVLRPIPTTDSLDESKPKDEMKPAEPSGAADSAPAPESGNDPAAAEGIFYRPLIGTVSKNFSMTEPVYSKTLNQYMVHTGVDVDAPLDTQVKAVAPGTVVAVFTDDKLGMTVQLVHKDGVVTQYSNLSTGILVEEGDVVERGQPIGGVGNTALFESLDPPHLHFEVLDDELPVDPNEYVHF